VDADSYQRMCQRLISQKRELYDGEFKSKVGAPFHESCALYLAYGRPLNCSQSIPMFLHSCGNSFFESEAW
jgi:hypothetical protein